MGTILAFLLCLASTNPMVGDKPTLYVDGYIELNHYWDQTNGNIIIDQVIIWKYNEHFSKDNFDSGRFDILHWHIVKDGREIDRITPWEYKRDLDKLTSYITDSTIVSEINMMLATLLANHKRQEIKDWIKLQKRLGQLEFAKENKENPDRFIVFVASKWLGGRGYGRIDFNQDVQMYETMIEVQGRPLWIRAKHFKESSTLFDPETEYKQIYNIGSTRMSKHPIFIKEK